MHLSEEQINQYLDSLLDETEQQVIEAHLAACADCRRRVDELQALLADLEALPELPLFRDLTPAVLAKLSPERGEMEFRPTPAWTRALAAQWGLVTGFALWLGMQMTTIVELPVLLLPNITLPALRLPALPLDMLPGKFPIYKLPIYRLPMLDLQMPSFLFHLSYTHLALLVVSAFLLGMLGNFTLLRSRPEVRE